MSLPERCEHGTVLVRCSVCMSPNVPPWRFQYGDHWEYRCRDHVQLETDLLPEDRPEQLPLFTSEAVSATEGTEL